MRFTASLPDELYGQLQHTAEQEGVAIAALLRRFIKLGLLAYWAQQRDSELVLRRDDREVPLRVV